jgi:uncharacterized protein (DUF2249 family)
LSIGGNLTTTTINVDVFKDSYLSGLLFSLFEGLAPGECFKIVSKKGLEELKTQINDAQVENLKIEKVNSSQGVSEAIIRKIPEQNLGCCGMCGGHK